jgi:hypothetical protein
MASRLPCFGRPVAAGYSGKFLLFTTVNKQSLRPVFWTKSPISLDGHEPVAEIYEQVPFIQWQQYEKGGHVARS